MVLHCLVCSFCNQHLHARGRTEAEALAGASLLLDIHLAGHVDEIVREAVA